MDEKCHLWEGRSHSLEQAAFNDGTLSGNIMSVSFLNIRKDLNFLRSIWVFTICIFYTDTHDSPIFLD